MKRDWLLKLLGFRAQILRHLEPTEVSLVENPHPDCRIPGSTFGFAIGGRYRTETRWRWTAWGLLGILKGS